MISKKRASVLLAAPAVMLVLSSCALIEPANTSTPPTAMELCAMGQSWSLDTVDASEKLAGMLAAARIPATGVVPTGGQTLTWNSNGEFTITSDLAFAISATPEPEQVMAITQSYAGEITGKAFINVDVAIPRKWDDSKYTVATTAVLGEAPVEAIPYSIPRSDFNDVLGLVLSCEADVLTINPRGTDLVQVWKKAN